MNMNMATDWMKDYHCNFPQVHVVWFSDDPRRMLEQARRQCGRAQLLGQHQGNRVQTVVNHTQCQNVATSAINLFGCDGQRLASVKSTNLNSELEM